MKQQIKVCHINKYAQICGNMGIFNNVSDYDIIETDSYEDCDFINIAGTHAHFEKERYDWIKHTKIYEEYKHKIIISTHNDNPDFAYEDNVRFLVSSTLKPRSENIKHNVYTIPMLSGNGIQIQNDKDFINKCRHNEKIYDYIFIGKLNNSARKIIKDLSLDNFYFKDTTGTINQGGFDFKEYLTLLSKSKFVLCPRGIGSSSYRLYESMMVGSVPIEWGMYSYPFEEIVNWDDFCIRSEPFVWHIQQIDSTLKNKVDQCIYKSGHIDYNKFRVSCMSFFDEFISNNKTNSQIIKYCLI